MSGLDFIVVRMRTVMDVEGKYYVFTPQEVVAVLGTEDGQIFNQRYGITEEGNF